jgi:hypothetical protein
MGRRVAIIIQLPGKSFRLGSTWVVEREGRKILFWPTRSDYRKKLKGTIHSQAFESEEDAQGALHLFTEAIAQTYHQNEVKLDLRGLCFWESQEEGIQEEDEGPRPKGTSLLEIMEKLRY